MKTVLIILSVIVISLSLYVLFGSIMIIYYSINNRNIKKRIDKLKND